MVPDDLSKTDLFVIRSYWLKKQGRWGPVKLALPTLFPGVIVFWVCVAMAQKAKADPNPRTVMIFVLGLAALIASLIAMLSLARNKFERWLAPIPREQLPQLFSEISKFRSEAAAERRKRI